MGESSTSSHRANRLQKKHRGKDLELYKQDQKISMKPPKKAARIRKNKLQDAAIDDLTNIDPTTKAVLNNLSIERKSKSHETPQETREAFIIMRRSGVPNHLIAKYLNVTERTVKRWVKRYESDQDLSTKPREGRPKLTTQEEDLKILEMVNLNPYITGKEICQQFQLKCSPNTIRRRLKAAGKLFFMPDKIADWKPKCRRNRGKTKTNDAMSPLELPPETYCKDPLPPKLGHWI